MAAPEPGKRKLAVIVGAGFSAALSAPFKPIIGRGAVPTLRDLSAHLLSFAEALAPWQRLQIPFSEGIVDEAIRVLAENEKRPPDARLDFEQLVSIISIQSSLFAGTLAERFSPLPAGVNPAVLRCLVSILSLLLQQRLSLSDKRANTSFWYKVSDAVRCEALVRGIRGLARRHDVTFISLNYDGLLEACLATYLGESDVYLYFPFLSHGIPLASPSELVIPPAPGRNRVQGFTTVLKPHGSMHFFRLRSETAALLSDLRVFTLWPRLELGFKTWNDLGTSRAWEVMDPVPFLVPPLLNKGALLGSDYFREILRLSIEALRDAEAVVSLGFSLPPSDIHIGAAFGAIHWAGKPLSLCFLRSNDDLTLRNWMRVTGGLTPAIVRDGGLPVESAQIITEFWQSLDEILP